MQTLRQTSQLQNTTSVFASDNGGVNATRNNNAPYPDKKRTNLEGGCAFPSSYIGRERLRQVRVSTNRS